MAYANWCFLVVFAAQDDEKADLRNQPCLRRRDMFYRRPWGDFLVILTQKAQDWYYVTEETAKSYSRIAIQPFARDLLAKKYTEGPRKKFRDVGLR